MRQLVTRLSRLAGYKEVRVNTKQEQNTAIARVVCSRIRKAMQKENKPAALDLAPDLATVKVLLHLMLSQDPLL